LQAEHTFDVQPAGVQLSNVCSACKWSAVICVMFILQGGSFWTCDAQLVGGLLLNVCCSACAGTVFKHVMFILRGVSF